MIHPGQAAGSQGSSLSGATVSRGFMAMVLTIGLLLGHAAAANAIEVIKPKAVVELFTSQGCSSCPPADEILRQFNQGDEILGLALHVDYWDRLGWEDTFGSAANTKRQKRYAQSFEARSVYTPQAVVNGRDHFIGSHGDAITTAASEFAARGDGLYVKMDAQREDDILSLSIAGLEDAGKATLYAVYFNRERTVRVERGENKGRELTYSNIVGSIDMLGMVPGDGKQVSLSIRQMKAKGYDDCAFIIQETGAGGVPGPIIGAIAIRDL